MNNEKSNFDKVNFNKYLLGILVFAFIFSSISSVLFMSNKYNVIIGKYKKVNINEFVNILNNEKRAMASLKLTEEQLAQLNSREFMVSTLSKVLYSKLIDMEIENFAIQKPKQLILDDIILEENFYTDGKFDIRKLEGLLEKYNITEQDYIKMLQESYNKRFLLDTIVSIRNVNDYSLDILQSEINKYKDIDVFSIEKGKLESYSGDVDEKEIKHYYNNNINKFILPEERQLDYVKIVDYTEEQIEKFELLKSKGLTIQEIANEMNLKVNTYGFLKKEDIDNNDKYQDIPNIFEYNIGKISSPKRKEKDVYFYCVVDKKDSRVKNIDEVERDIKLAIQDEKTEKIQIESVKKIIEEYRNGGFNSEFLTFNGFKIKSDKCVTNRSEGYEDNFLVSILMTEKGNVTEVFSDNKFVYFAFIKAEGALTKNNKNYINISDIRNGLFEDNNDKLFRYYTNYLRDKKYKLRINYKLLDLIK